MKPKSIGRLCIVLVLLIACAMSVAAADVTIRGQAFAPGIVEINVDDTVTWTNTEELPHTVSADDNSFSSGTLQNGQSFTHTFNVPGTFTYHCSFHPTMTGTIRVRSAAEGDVDLGPAGEFIRAFMSGLLGARSAPGDEADDPEEEGGEGEGVGAVISLKETFTPMPKVSVEFDESVSIMTGRIFFLQEKRPDIETLTADDLPPEGFLDLVDGIPSKNADNEWVLEPDRSLPPGFYVAQMKALDMVGNEAEFKKFFTVDYETIDIRITRPKLGVSPTRDFSLQLSTYKNGAPINTMCKYSTRNPQFRFFNVGMVSSNTFGPTHDFEEFSKVSFLDLTPNRRGNTFYVICRTENGEVAQREVEVYVDTEAPTITKAKFDPERIVEIPDDHNFFSDLVIETNEEVQCKYATQGNVEYDDMFPFDGFDRELFHKFVNPNKKQMQLPEPEVKLQKIFYVQCEDRIGRESNKVPVGVSIDLSVPIRIGVSSPPAVSKVNDVTLNFTTNKISRCFYKIGEVSEFLQDEQNPAKTHSAIIGTLPDGEHSMEISCETNKAGKKQTATKTVTFLIDTTGPGAPTFEGDALSCTPHKFKLGISVTAEDVESGIKMFRYLVAETEKNGTFGARNGIGTLPTVKPQLPEVEDEDAPIPAFSHTVIVSAINNVGLEGAAAPVTLNYDPNNPSCQENDPPRVILTKNSQPGLVTVEFRCADESGCDPNSLFYGLGGENQLGAAAGTAASCEPSNLIDRTTPVEVRRSREICWKAKDTVGNEAQGKETVVVPQAQTCTNGVQDEGESGIDCGGSCGNTCAEGGTCTSDDDCLGEYCVEGQCIAPKCDDDRKNGDETAKDCGGLVCSRCDLNATCQIGNDCISEYCGEGVCKIASCTDGAKNGKETDVDCGGDCPSKCINGKTCQSETDCVSNYCGLGRCDNKPGTAPVPGAAPAGSTTTATTPEKEEGGFLSFIWSNLIFIIGFLMIGGGAGYLALASKPSGKAASAKPALITPIKKPISRFMNATKQSAAKSAQRVQSVVQQRRQGRITQRHRKRQSFFSVFSGKKKAAVKQAKTASMPAGQQPPRTQRVMGMAKRFKLAPKLVEKLPSAQQVTEWLPLHKMHAAVKRVVGSKPQTPQGAIKTRKGTFDGLANKQRVQEKHLDEMAHENAEDELFNELERHTR